MTTFIHVYNCCHPVWGSSLKTSKMEKYRAVFGTLKLSLVIFTGVIVHHAKCQSELKTVYFAKLAGVLQPTSVSGPEMTCSIASCAASCLPQNGCRLFSYNPTNEKCILGRPPDGPDSTHYATYHPGNLCFLCSFRL